MTITGTTLSALLRQAVAATPHEEDPAPQEKSSSFIKQGIDAVRSLISDVPKRGAHTSPHPSAASKPTPAPKAPEKKPGPSTVTRYYDILRGVKSAADYRALRNKAIQEKEILSFVLAMQIFMAEHAKLTPMATDIVIDGLPEIEDGERASKPKGPAPDPLKLARRAGARLESLDRIFDAWLKKLPQSRPSKSFEGIGRMLDHPWGVSPTAERAALVYGFLFTRGGIFSCGHHAPYMNGHGALNVLLHGHGDENAFSAVWLHYLHRAGIGTGASIAGGEMRPLLLPEMNGVPGTTDTLEVATTDPNVRRRERPRGKTEESIVALPAALDIIVGRDLALEGDFEIVFEKTRTNEIEPKLKSQVELEGIIYPTHTGGAWKFENDSTSRIRLYYHLLLEAWSADPKQLDEVKQSELILLAARFEDRDALVKLAKEVKSEDPNDVLLLAYGLHVTGQRKTGFEFCLKQDGFAPEYDRFISFFGAEAARRIKKSWPRARAHRRRTLIGRRLSRHVSRTYIPPVDYDTLVPIEGKTFTIAANMTTVTSTDSDGKRQYAKKTSNRVTPELARAIEPVLARVAKRAGATEKSPLYVRISSAYREDEDSDHRFGTAIDFREVRLPNAARSTIHDDWLASKEIFKDVVKESRTLITTHFGAKPHTSRDEERYLVDVLLDRLYQKQILGACLLVELIHSGLTRTSQRFGKLQILAPWNLDPSDRDLTPHIDVSTSRAAITLFPELDLFTGEEAVLLHSGPYQAHIHFAADAEILKRDYAEPTAEPPAPNALSDIEEPFPIDAAHMMSE